MEKKMLEKFNEVYGEGGDIREYFAPGRVNLIGEHRVDAWNLRPCAEKEGQKASFLFHELFKAGGS